MYTLGPGIWRENRKSWKMRHKHSLKRYIARNIQKRENEKCTLQYLEYGEKL